MLYTATTLFFPLIFIFILGYFFVIQAQQKLFDNKKKIQKHIHLGDEIKTTTGLRGIVLAIEDSYVLINFEDGLKRRILKHLVIKNELY